MKRKILGVFLISIPFMGAGYYGYYMLGWEAIIPIGICVVVFLLVKAGVYLISE